MSADAIDPENSFGANLHVFLRDPKDGLQAVQQELQRIRSDTGNPRRMFPGTPSAVSAAAQYRPWNFLLAAFPVKKAIDIFTSHDPSSLRFPAPGGVAPPYLLGVHPRHPRLSYELALLSLFAPSAAQAVRAMKADPLEAELLELSTRVAHVHDYLRGLPAKGAPVDRLIFQPALVNIPVIDGLHTVGAELWADRDKDVSSDILSSALASPQTAYMLAALRTFEFGRSLNEIKPRRSLFPQAMPFRQEEFVLGPPDAEGTRAIQFNPARAGVLKELRRAASKPGSGDFRREGCVALQSLPNLLTDWQSGGAEQPREVGIGKLNTWIANASYDLGLFRPGVAAELARMSHSLSFATYPQRPLLAAGLTASGFADLGRSLLTLGRDTVFNRSL